MVGGPLSALTAGSVGGTAVRRSAPPRKGWGPSADFLQDFSRAKGGAPPERGHLSAATGLDSGPLRGQPDQAPAAWKKRQPWGKFPRGKNRAEKF